MLTNQASALLAIPRPLPVQNFFGKNLFNCREIEGWRQDSPKPARADKIHLAFFALFS